MASTMLAQVRTSRANEREEKRAATEENRPVVSAANMLFLESNAGFPLWYGHSVTETIIQRAKEKSVRLGGERETSKMQFFVMPFSCSHKEQDRENERIDNADRSSG
jgi:hypothetical protein